MKKSNLDEATERGSEEYRLTVAVNIIANYIVKHGNAGVAEVERQLKRMVTTKRSNPQTQQQQVRETIRSMVKEALNEMTAK